MDEFADDIAKYRKIFEFTPPDELIRMNKTQAEESRMEQMRFSEAYDRGECHICNQPFEHKDNGNPCLHWLLRRNKFRSKEFSKIYQKYSYHQIASFLRWCANKERFLSNINDLENEKDPKKLISYTIRWKNVAWSFDCTVNDFKGHGGEKTNFSHYHFQMFLDNQIFIKFNQHHVPFTDEDQFYIKLKNSGETWFKYSFGSIGDGMEAATSVPLDLLLEHVEPSENEEDAVYHMSTMIDACENPLTGEEIYQAQKEAERTGKSMTYILQKNMKNRPNTDIQTVVSPVDSIPDITERTKHKKR